MARIRTIKPEFFRHRRLFLLEQETGLPVRVAYPALWTVADRDGRFRWEPIELKLDCLPYDDVDFGRVLDALTTRGFVVRYEVDGKEYGWIPGFAEHQVINNRESASTLPAPPKNAAKSAVAATRAPRENDASPTRHDLAQGEGKGREGKGRSPSPTPSESPAAAVAEPRLVDGSIIDELRIFVWRISGLSEDAVQTRLVSTRVEGLRQVRGWLDLGLTPDQIRAAITRAYDGAEARGETIRHPWVYLDEVMKSEAERLTEAAKEADATASLEDSQWRMRLRNHALTGDWLDLQWGPPPGIAGCRVPVHLLQPDLNGGKAHGRG